MLVSGEAGAQSGQAGQTSAAASEAEILARLTPEQRRIYQSHRAARMAFEHELDAYWATIDARKADRRRKRAAGEPFTAADFVIGHPPKYVGPQLPPEIAAIVAAVRPPPPETPLPTVADYLQMARSEYGFVPEPATEQEFKRRYAAEALALGLTKDQVVRVYALETGGRGTYDMQSGVDPESRKGKPISSALGYAQLLHGNSVNELVNHGDRFVFRLRAMSAAPGTHRDRARRLLAKAKIVQAMLRVARSVPNDWSEHVKLGGSQRGMGIHALNLDADIGPWLQVTKLHGLKELAARNGRTALAGAEIELMNLAGPRTGLDMMEPTALGASTANFFSQGGYSRNTIVRDKSAAELLKALDERMDVNLQRPGSIEFAAIFDEVAASMPPAASPALSPMRAQLSAPRPVRAASPPNGLGLGVTGLSVFDSRN
jgi:hypothetical protein